MEAKSSAKAKPCRLGTTVPHSRQIGFYLRFYKRPRRQTREIWPPSAWLARQRASPAFLLTHYREATYAAALSAAIAPSETAVTTWRKPFARTSPATNTPGTLVVPDSSATM